MPAEAAGGERKKLIAFHLDAKVLRRLRKSAESPSEQVSIKWRKLSLKLEVIAAIDPTQAYESRQTNSADLFGASTNIFNWAALKNHLKQIEGWNMQGWLPIRDPRSNNRRVVQEIRSAALGKLKHNESIIAWKDEDGAIHFVIKTRTDTQK